MNKVAKAESIPIETYEKERDSGKKEPRGRTHLSELTKFNIYDKKRPCG